MTFLRPLALTAALAALTGCMSSPVDPAELQAKAERSQAQEATLKAELGPLLSKCIAMLEGGAAPTEASMVQRGWQVDPREGYVKPITENVNRPHSPTRFSAEFDASEGHCKISAHHYGSLQVLGHLTHDKLEAAGFSNSGHAHLFSKGRLTLGVSITYAPFKGEELTAELKRI